MRDKLRRRYQVHKEVSRNGSFEGNIALAELGRLSELLYPGDSSGQERDLEVRFEFVRNEYDLPTVTGRLATRLELECQRCLGSLEMPLELEFRLMIDAQDELLRSSSVDTLYSEDGYIDIYEVVEDELILAIPLVALHDDRACNEHWRNPETETDSAATDNPFAVLQKLKTAD
jgi:uncharacterized protein